MRILPLFVSTVKMIISELHIAFIVSSCYTLARSNTVTVLLECVVFHLHGRYFRRLSAMVSVSLPLYFIVSLAIIANLNVLCQYLLLLCQHFTLGFCLPIILLTKSELPQQHQFRTPLTSQICCNFIVAACRA